MFLFFNVFMNRLKFQEDPQDFNNCQKCSAESNLWIVYFFQNFYFTYLKKKKLKPFHLCSICSAAWPLVFRRMFKIESDDTQTRIRATELSQDAIWFFFFPKTSDVTESRLEQHDKRKLAFQKEVQKAQGPIVGWKTCSPQLVSGLYLVFQEFLFCSSSFHTPVNNLQTKCNVQ